MNDQIFMKQALRQAEQAASEGEVPVGAVLVFEGEIVARAHNRVEALQDASAHAELLCLRAGSEALGNWRLSRTTLYSTLEPCAMCAGAMLLSRIERLVWGAPDIRHGAHGSWTNLLDQPHPIHKIKVDTHVCQDEAASLMINFFKERRENGKNSRRDDRDAEGQAPCPCGAVHPQHHL